MKTKLLNKLVALGATSLVISVGSTSRASTTAFLCGLDLVEFKPYVPTKIPTTTRLAFYIGNSEIADLDRVIKSYLEMTADLPVTNRPSRNLYGDFVMDVQLRDVLDIHFRNTHDLLAENERLMATLLREAPIFKELIAHHSGQQLSLRKIVENAY